MAGSNPSGDAVMIVTGIFFTLASISVFMRLYAKFIVLQRPGLDELAIIASYTCSIFLLAMTNEQVKHGLGKHVQDVSNEDFSDMLKFLWISISFYNASLFLTKASLILQYLRVFPAKDIRRACWAFLAILAAYGIYATLTNIFNCTPIPAFWNLTKDPHCIDKKFLWFFNASFNIVSDLIILILPMPIVAALKLPFRQKVGLMMIFALGGFVCLVSVLRLRSLYIISVSTDPTFDNTGAAIWSNVESYTGIICASLPAIKPIVVKLFPRLMPSTASGRTVLRSYDNSNKENINRFTMGPTPARISDPEMGRQTVTRVEVNERREKGNSVSMGKDIYVTMSMRQDVQSLSDSESEKDLIIQYPDMVHNRF